MATDASVTDAAMDEYLRRARRLEQIRRQLDTFVQEEVSVKEPAYAKLRHCVISIATARRLLLVEERKRGLAPPEDHA